MKKFLTLLLLLLMVLSGCTKKEDPADLLKNARDKMAAIENSTWDGTMNIVSGEDGGAGITLPINYTLMADKAQGVLYMLMDMTYFGQTITTENWQVGQDIYTDDGYSKTHTTTDDPAWDEGSNLVNVLDDLIKYMESITVEDSGSDKIVTMRIKEDSYFKFLQDFNSEAEMTSLLDGSIEDLKIDDIVLTIDKEGLLRRLATAFSCLSDGVNVSIDMDMTMRDEGRTVVPSFDPSEFTDEGDDTVYDGSFEEIVFDNDLDVVIFMDGFDTYKCYFDDEDQFLVIFNDDYLYSDGLFLNGDFAREFYASLDSTMEYEIRSEREVTCNVPCRMRIGYSPNETDFFNPETPFAIVTFEDIDLGIAFVGYGSEAEFADVMAQVSFEIRTGE